MASSDSMFIFDMCVKDLKSYTACKQFHIRSQFADIFKFFLKDPNENLPVLPRPRKRKSLISYSKAFKSKNIENEDFIGQSVLLASSLDRLVSNMTKYPIELSLWSKIKPVRLGSTHIPWSSVFFRYLKGLQKKYPTPSAVQEAEYFVFDEITSRRMATIRVFTKLTHLGNNVTMPVTHPTISENSCDIKYDQESDPNQRTMKADQSTDIDVSRDTGTIKTIYGGGTRKFRLNIGKKKHTQILTGNVSDDASNETKTVEVAANTTITEEINNMSEDDKINKSTASLVKSRSDADIDSNKQIAIRKSLSYSAIELRQRLDTLNYIFGDPNVPFGNRVYCVGYVTVQNDDLANSPTSKSTTSKVSIKLPTEKSPSSPSENFFQANQFRPCGSECLVQRGVDGSCMQNICSIELPDEAAHMINIRKCTNLVTCDNLNRDRPESPKETIHLGLNSLSQMCCQKVEEVTGGITGVMAVGRDPCYCSCECRFGFTKKTTYCTVCGGYEIAGDEMTKKSGLPPFPCPIYHNLTDKNKTKATSGKNFGDIATSGKNFVDLATSGKNFGDFATSGKNFGDFAGKAKSPKSFESEKDSKKGKKKKKDDRFKFNYGYQGIPPKIGHSQCAMPCTGTLGPVPKNMGWLWTADNIPGLKFRPNWKPGATNKHVVRLLKIAKNPEQVLAKRRRRDTGKKKRPLKRPLLIVHKKDGEFTVTMETMRIFSKQRSINQHAFEDKDPMTFTIGRTKEENRERQRRKERAQRRLEREQRSFIESTFKDMCQEICLKTYQQALELLPDAEDPNCSCNPAEPGPDKMDLEHSCSCSDQSKSDICSDTDDDEWIVEFTPPNAYFNPTYKSKKLLKADAGTQYTYMDYRVKLLDRYGNLVPRFFTGSDGKQKCSDLGGFWGPDKTWIEINIDGYVGPDGKWAPNSFIGPSGELVDAEAGKFQITNNGAWLVVGVDGYVDGQNKWRYYAKPRDMSSKKQYKQTNAGTAGGDKKDNKEVKPSEATWSCFGDATPVQLSQMGIVGHGHDRQLLLSTLEKMMAQGEDVKIPQQPTVPHLFKSKRGRKYRMGPDGYDTRNYYTDRLKCRHPKPSVKGTVTDERGHKTYFRLTDHKNKRPKERLTTLGEQGISLSSFHMPCFSSFINSEVMKQQQYDRVMRYAKKDAEHADSRFVI